GNNIIIEYQEGKKNVVADALSRRSDHSSTSNADTIIDTTIGTVNQLNTVVTTTSISTSLTTQIISGYQSDDLCKQILSGNVSVLKKNISSRRS
ncbi:hypothetical protein, partial [Salmonella enterica]|uniref:hypothetical protein n=1 Tax=Salmonella enterica TaxID=28901 RepID=UPI0032986B1E